MAFLFSFSKLIGNKIQRSKQETRIWCFYSFLFFVFNNTWTLLFLFTFSLYYPTLLSYSIFSLHFPPTFSLLSNLFSSLNFLSTFLTPFLAPLFHHSTFCSIFSLYILTPFPVLHFLLPLSHSIFSLHFLIQLSLSSSFPSLSFHFLTLSS